MSTTSRYNRRDFLMVAGPAALVVTQASAIALLAPSIRRTNCRITHYERDSLKPLWR
jgi:hypothetical protein